MISLSALNPEESLESPKPHQPQPNTISISQFPMVNETRLQHTIMLKTQVVTGNSDSKLSGQVGFATLFAIWINNV